MVRPSTSFVDPEYFASGNIAKQTATEDTYFLKEIEPAVRTVVDEFLQLVPEWKRSAVQMCIMANMTYADAAEKISLMRGKRTHKKTVWRWAQQGLVELREFFEVAPWVSTMTDGKIPVEQQEKQEPVVLPWRD
jgi:DNA-directed RNA polymerase specialized sigma24 family protein